MFMNRIALLSCIIALILSGNAYGRLGYIDRTGNVVITLSKEITWAGEFDESGLAAVNVGGAVTQNQSFAGGKWGFIDRTGKLVIPFQFDQVRAFHEGMCAVAIGTKWGFIDRTGRIRIAPTYLTVRDFSDGLASASFNWDRQFFIDKSGKTVIPAKFGGWSTFSEGLAGVIVPRDNMTRWPKMGYIDRTGRLVIQPQFVVAQDFSEGLASVIIREQQGGKIRDLFGYIDKSGKMVIPLKAEGGESFSDGRAAFHHGGKCGYIDKRGNFVIKPRFNWCSGFSEGLALVEYGKSGKASFAYVDTAGKLISPPMKAQRCTRFSDGLAAFMVGARITRSGLTPIGGTWGFINRKGAIVIAPRFKNFLQTPQFHHGLAAVSID
jgi:hypothetical protein